MFESCGIADLIATCHGGRNRRVGEEFGRRRIKMLKTSSSSAPEEKELSDVDISKSLKTIWEQVEKDVLQGQKMQGLGTLVEVITCLNAYQLKYDCDLKHGNSKKFPLFYRIFEISLKGAKLDTLFDDW